MKKVFSILLCIAMLISFCPLCVMADFTQASLEISCDDGKIIVNGSFESSVAGESYRITLANFNEDNTLKRIIGISDLVEIAEGTNTVSYSVDMPDLMADEEKMVAYLWTEDMEPICRPAEKIVTSLKVLALGSSFNIDSTRQLYYIAEDAGIDNIVVANIYNGSSTLKEHCGNIDKMENDDAADDESAAAYEYHKNSTGDWIVESKKTILYGIEDEKWNMIILNQGAYDSPDESTYQGDGEVGYLTKYIKYINKKKTNPEARLAWNTAWAIDNDYNIEGGTFIKYGGKQEKMYEGIVNAVKMHVVPLLENGALDVLIPSGTAMQNVRDSFIGDNLSREDNVHASENQGRYTAALTLFKCITGITDEEMAELKYVPKICDDVMITENRLLAIKEAISNAVLNPYEVTKSTYKDASLANQDFHPMVDAPKGVKLNFNQMTAKASSESGTYVASNAIDGDAETRWTSYLGKNKESGPHSITIDLKSVRNISDIGIKWYNSDDRHYYFCIEVSEDGKTFTPVKNMGAYNPESTKSVQNGMLQSKKTATNGEIQYFTLEDTKARYIRYWGHGNDYETSALNYNHILEMEVYLQPEMVDEPFTSSVLVSDAETTLNSTTDEVQTMEIKLPQKQIVSDIGISWESSEAAQYSFTLETSADGVTYTPVKSFQSKLTDGMQYFNIVNADAQYIRYTGDKGVTAMVAYMQGELPPEPGLVVEKVSGKKITLTSENIIDISGEAEKYPSSNAVDGNTDATVYWQSNSLGGKNDSARSNGWITIDLKEKKTLTEIGLLTFKPAARQYPFWIEASTDGETFFPVFGSEEETINNPLQGSIVYYSLGNLRDVRYIKYWGKGYQNGSTSNAYIQLCELELYEASSATEE